MKPMMESRYVTWMAVRPLTFGNEEFAPGDKIPQKHLDGMRDPEVLVRTGRIAAVAKDMNKVPVYLRKDVTDEAEMRAKILAPRIASQIGVHKTNHLVALEKAHAVPDPAQDDARGVGGSAPGYNPDVAHTAAQEDEDAAGGPVNAPADYPAPAVPSIATIGSDGKVQNAQEETPDVDADEDIEVDENEGDKDVPAGQEPAETDTTQDTPEVAPEVAEPAKNATTEEWAEYAKSKGATEDDVDGKNRTELIAKYATPETPEES